MITQIFLLSRGKLNCYNLRIMDKLSFNKNESYKPRNQKEKFLIKTLLSVQNEIKMANLLRDLLTLPEIEEFSNRLEMVRLLLQGKSYKTISKDLKVSTTTVARVAHWLFRGCGGYWSALKNKLT